MTDGIVEVEGRWDDAGVLWYACPYCADVHVSREPGLDEPPCTLLLLVLNRQTSRGCVLVRRTLPIGPLELGEWLGEVEQEVRRRVVVQLQHRAAAMMLDSKTARRVRRITAALRAEIMARDGFRCRRCGASPSDGATALVVDHVWPVSRGGNDSIANLQTLCHACNAGKMASLPTPHDFGGAHA